MLPAGTPWAVPPEVAEKARMTDSGIPGFPYRLLESDELPFIDGNPAYGLQLHHPRFLELVGAPESERLLDHVPLYWVEEMGKERAMVAAVTLQRDAGVMLSNLQILSQFAMALNRMSFSMMALGVSESRSGRAVASTSCTMGGTVYFGHGVVAPSREFNGAKTCSDTVV